MSDVLDITEQLQKMADLTTDVDVINTGLKAIDEILRLRAENEKLRAALKPFADLSSHWEGDKMPLEPKTIIIDPLPVLYAVKETRND